MIGFIPLILILILNVHFVEKTNAGWKKEQPKEQVVKLKKEEDHPVVYYERGCLPSERRFSYFPSEPGYLPEEVPPCTPDNPEEFAKHGVDPNKTPHQKCPERKDKDGVIVIPECRYTYHIWDSLKGFICCVPSKEKSNEETMMFNKKAAYIMADILLRTTLFTDYGEQREKAKLNVYNEKVTIATLFKELHKFVEDKTKLDKKSIPNGKLHEFFKFLSEQNKGEKALPQKVIYKLVKEEKEKSNLFGFNKVLGINMEKELNKLCEHYKEHDPKHSNEYDVICKKVAKFIRTQFQNAEIRWLGHTVKVSEISRKKFEMEEYVEKLAKEYNKDGNKSNYDNSYRISQNQGVFDMKDLREVITFGEARNLYRQIWIRALNYALMSIDVCYFPSRINILWDEKVRKASKLGNYRAGMSNEKYLIYFLLEMIKQIHPKFNKRGDDFDEPYQAVRRDDVKLIDATLPKRREGGHGGSGPLNLNGLSSVGAALAFPLYVLGANS